MKQLKLNWAKKKKGKFKSSKLTEKKKQVFIIQKVRPPKKAERSRTYIAASLSQALVLPPYILNVPSRKRIEEKHLNDDGLAI